MAYLSEDPWLIVAGLVLLAGSFLIALRTTGQGKYLIWAGLSLGVAGLIIIVEWLWVTDNERIERVVYDLRRAVAASDVEGILVHFTPDVEYSQGEQALSDEAVRAMVRNTLSRAKFDFVRVSELRTSHGEQSRRGTAEFRVFAKGTLDTSLATLNVGTANSTWSLGFEETAKGVWKVNRITALSAPQGLSTAMPPPINGGLGTDPGRIRRFASPRSSGGATTSPRNR